MKRLLASAWIRTKMRLGRSPTALRMALGVKNQALSVIGFGFAGVGSGDAYYEQNEGLVIKCFAPRSTTFIDVGANVGEWTGQFMRHAAPGCRALLFEPNRETRAKLEERFAGNPQIEVCGKGLGDAEGQLEFFEEAMYGCSSSFVPGTADASAQATVVPISTLDAELERRGWATADFVKIDAEGFDLKVLRGAASALAGHRIKALEFEYGRSWLPAGATLYEALKLLHAHGYRTYVLRSDGLYRFDYEQLGEYFEYSIFVACVEEFDALAASIVRGVI